MANTLTAPPAKQPAVDKAASLALYEQMTLLRRFELAAQTNYKKGEMPGFIHLYIGEEAVAVGVCANLRRDDWITSTHRGHGHAVAKGADPRQVMAELYGRSGGSCGGRGGSMHLYDASVGLFGTNGFVGGGMPSAVGAAMSAKHRKTGGVTVSFFGDGATSHGAFHESINFAGAQGAPVIFVCENNMYATATPLTMATKNTDIASRAAAYGIPGMGVDGNDVLAMRDASAEAIARARAGGGPTLIEARTYRTVGHHEGDQLTGTYRTLEELDGWKTRDPILRFRKLLVEQGTATEAELDEIERGIAAKIDEATQFSRDSPWPDPSTANDHVWATPFEVEKQTPKAGVETQTLGWLDAVRDGIAEEMRRDPNILYLGEGTGERAGSFGQTKGLFAEFGPGRMIDTPIAELAFTGAAAGASATGCRTIADLMFVDFMFEAATQIIEQAGKLHYMSNGQLTTPMVIRAGWGVIKNTGPHHSGSYHPIWAHCPGLIVAVPSNPADAKGLMKSALRANDPVLILEPKVLFANKGAVPVGEHFVPFGQAAITREGTDLTIASCGSPLHRCLEAAEALAAQGISCEVIDLRTIVPLDVETVAESVIKTGRLLVVDEAFSMCGIGAELAASMMELAFDYLDAPVARLHTDPVTFPFSPPLENDIVITTEKIQAAIHSLLAGASLPPRRARPYRALQKNGASAAVTQAVAEPAPVLTGKTAPVPFNSEKSAPAPSAMDTVPPQESVRDMADVIVDDGEGTQIKMPNIGLTETEATLVTWRKAVGDKITEGEIVVEMQSEKVLVEVEAPASGTLTKILAQEGEVVKIGAGMGVIS